jgi:hypothetical protein
MVALFLFPFLCRFDMLEVKKNACMVTPFHTAYSTFHWGEENEWDTLKIFERSLATGP